MRSDSEEGEESFRFWWGGIDQAQLAMRTAGRTSMVLGGVSAANKPFNWY